MVLFSLGAGLITTYSLTTSFGKWFGFQVLTGAGIGVGFQGAIITVQTVLPLVDVPVGTACIQFFQSLGGALFIAVSQTLFQNGLVSGIEEYAPQLDAQIFLASGATQIREILASLDQEDALDDVLKAYVRGLSHTYWVTAACAILAFLSSCGLEWRTVKQGPGQENAKASSNVDGASLDKERV